VLVSTFVTVMFEGVEAAADAVASTRDVGESAVVETAARHGLGVNGVAPYRMASEGAGGLIFGYAALNEPTIVEGINLLADVIHQLRSARAIAGSPGARSREARSMHPVHGHVDSCGLPGQDADGI
jgi:hypothetical protein